METPKYNRIVLKLSGESLMGDKEFGLDPDTVKAAAKVIGEIHELGVQVGVVLGGGNIFRGLAGSQVGLDRVTADHMGMLATMINCLALQDYLEKENTPVRTMTAVPMNNIAEPFIRRRAIRHMEKGRVVIFGAGTGNPYFTTDTAAALRGTEIHADAILKATQVDGIYDKDPKLYADAVMFDNVTYHEALQKRLKVMDATAFSLCMENKMPIVVFNVRPPSNIRKAVLGHEIGTTVTA